MPEHAPQDRPVPAPRRNVRSIVHFLASAVAGEILLVVLAVSLGTSVPFGVAQLLWLNLVTNGLLAAALAFEPEGTGTGSARPTAADTGSSRSPGVFDRVMIERTLLAGVTFAGIGLAFWLRVENHPVPEARNMVLQLFVFFGMMHVLSARSWTTSLLRLSPFRNPVLLPAWVGALGLHLAALHAPPLQGLLGTGPIYPADWVALAVMASLIVVVMEAHKWMRGGDVVADGDGEAGV